MQKNMGCVVRNLGSDAGGVVNQLIVDHFVVGPVLWTASTTDSWWIKHIGYEKPLLLATDGYSNSIITVGWRLLYLYYPLLLLPKIPTAENPRTAALNWCYNLRTKWFPGC